MTPSQAESPSAPEAIENQRSRGGPWGTVSLLWGTLIPWHQYLRLLILSGGGHFGLGLFGGAW